MDQRAEKSPLLVNAAAAGVIGPATEELLFRRFLYKGLKSMGKEKSSLISSVIFGQGIYAALWGKEASQLKSTFFSSYDQQSAVLFTDPLDQPESL